MTKGDRDNIVEILPLIRDADVKAVLHSRIKPKILQ